jgi:molybdate-binding protein
VRPAGSEARALQERLAAEVGLSAPANTVAAATHTDAARAVAVGAADVAVTTASAAALYGLAFRPCSVEPFDWVVPLPVDARLERFFAFLARTAVRRRLGHITGYDAAESGRPVWEIRRP